MSFYAPNINPKPHQLMTCPYNMSHQIEHYRMQVHLEKCRKQHPTSSNEPCPFDATHKIPKVEIDHHVCVCSKRAMFDNQQYAVDDGVPARVVPPPPATAGASNEELWDDDQPTSYVPNPTRRGAHIITKIKGATRSERRQARMEGVRNYRPLEE